MDFNLPEELQMLKDTVRKFVDRELIPNEMHTIENMELKPDIRERLEKKTKDMGLWMFDVPGEYGGGRRRVRRSGAGVGLGRAGAHGRAAVAWAGDLRSGDPADSLRVER